MCAVICLRWEAMQSFQLALWVVIVDYLVRTLRGEAMKSLQLTMWAAVCVL